MVTGKYPLWAESARLHLSELFHRYTIPKWIVFTHDILAVFITFIVACLLRFNFTTEYLKYPVVFFNSFTAILIYSAFILTSRSYAGLIRHTTLTDVALVFVSTSASSVVLGITSLLSGLVLKLEYLAVPASIILIHYVLITVYLFFMRISVKILFIFAHSSMRYPVKRVLIYGAGEMGFIVKRVISSDPRDGFIVAGFIDDNKKLQGKKINGIQVYNPNILVNDFISKNKIQTVIIAIRNFPVKRKSEIIQKSIKSNLEVLEAPAVEKWLNGRLEISNLQKVNLLDLLGREPIKLNLELIRRELKGKTVLVTGSAGSIGSELIRQLSNFGTKLVILVDQAETPMFHLDNELKREFMNLKYEIQISDVTNYAKMNLIFNRFRPDVVFHAAAYKHVHLMEISPHEAFRVNVGGTKNVADLSEKYGVKKFVMISTDKSVNPTSIMGASKRICELLIQSKAAKAAISTQFMITRFGNVLGSNGSVIPLFKEQILLGGPVTVTHPDITRYFMTIPEACELVLEAGSMGKGGEIFVFDMGNPVKIYDMACNMIRLSGFEPGKEIKIEFTGLRPGEKLFEEPLSNKEKLLPTHHKKIKIANSEDHDYVIIISQINYFLNNLYSLSEQQIFRLFEDFVPEFRSSHTYAEPKTHHKLKPAGTFSSSWFPGFRLFG